MTSPTDDPLVSTEWLAGHLDDPEITIDDLCEIVPGPDFPTGATILGRGGILSAYHKGRGSIMMRGRVEIEEIRCTTAGDLLKIDVVVYNDESDTERLQYKFRWADAEGMRAADEESWKPLLMYGNSRQTVTVVAPNPKARDFKFIVMGQE